MDGGQYSVVPADLEPGGGFCVSLDRDFVGETNMSSMLYVRKRGGAQVNGDVGKEGPAAGVGEEDDDGEEEGKEEGVKEEPIALLPSKVSLQRALESYSVHRQVEASVPSLGLSSCLPGKEITTTVVCL